MQDSRYILLGRQQWDARFQVYFTRQPAVGCKIQGIFYKAASSGMQDSRYILLGRQQWDARFKVYFIRQPAVGCKISGI